MSITPFVKADVISNRLNRQFRYKEFDPELVAEYCAQAEIEYIADVNIMNIFKSVPLTVGFQKMVLLPCNVFRILEVYNDSDPRLSYNKTATHLTHIIDLTSGEEVEEDDTIYITYIGVPVDPKTGEILIPSGHEPALETYCKMKFFEEDALLGKIDKNMWVLWSNQFSGQVSHVKSSFRHIDRLKINNLNVIQGNMLPQIGRLPLIHEQFEE